MLCCATPEASENRGRREDANASEGLTGLRRGRCSTPYGIPQEDLASEQVERRRAATSQALLDPQEWLHLERQYAYAGKSGYASELAGRCLQTRRRRRLRRGSWTEFSSPRFCRTSSQRSFLPPAAPPSSRRTPIGVNPSRLRNCSPNWCAASSPGTLPTRTR